jgi:hypothetical protein
LFVGSLIFNITFATGIEEQERIINELRERIESDEKVITLENSVGYWSINKPEEVNDSLLYKLLKDTGAWYPDILLKQAKLESGDYKSGLYKEAYNLYGMKRVSSRATTQIGSYIGYGAYANWCLSALDRILWDEYRFKGKKPTREEYLKALDIYAEAESYQNMINNVKVDIELEE